MSTLSKYIYLYSKYLLIFLMSALAILVLAQVFMRNIPMFSIAWSEEISRYLLVWVTFIGATVALRDDELIGLDFIQEKVSIEVNKVIKLIVNLLVLLFLFVVLYYGYQAVTSRGISNQTLNSINISMRYVYLVIPLSMALMIIHMIAAISINIKEVRGKAK